MTNLVTLLITLFGLYAAPLAQNGPISVGQTDITNEYPATVTFEVEAESTAGTIDAVEFNLAVRGAASVSMEPAEFEPGPKVVARFSDSISPLRTSNVRVEKESTYASAACAPAASETSRSLLAMAIGSRFAPIAVPSTLFGPHRTPRICRDGPARMKPRARPSLPP